MKISDTLSWEDIFELKRKGEKRRVDFKTIPFMDDNEEMAAQLTSFANRYGGRILIGVKDDERLQGWDALEGEKIDRDESLLHVSNVARDKCSPPVEFTSDFLASDRGDVLVLNVERREGTPHAVVERAGHEIRKRTYYIRTESGKRLASDRMLDYMFKNLEDPYLEHSFAIGMQYIRCDLKIPAAVVFDLSYKAVRCISPFIRQLKADDIKFLKEKSNRILSFFLEVLPYAMIRFLSEHFWSSWVVKIEKIGPSTTISPFKYVDKKEVTLEDISEPPETTLLSKLSLDVRSVLGSQFFKLMLPPETELEIIFPPETPHISKLQLTRHNSFEFDFSFYRGDWSVGADALTPLYGVLDSFEEHRKLSEAIATIIMKGNLSCQFAFPDIDDPLFGKVYRWGQLIVELVREQWDWDAMVRRLPERKLFSIETYLKKILEILEKQVAK